MTFAVETLDGERTSAISFRRAESLVVPSELCPLVLFRFERLGGRIGPRRQPDNDPGLDTRPDERP
ncbi:MAG: hypothetical protein ABS79_07775 [Planctomycetes bacterium SCN 63-9]|nr:MAG: hypothetical protein ABS79_07775 [Planctomycetes bacterium SCN 63-9]